MTRRRMMLVTALLAWACIARGYVVGPPLPLEKLADKADIIFKGTAISSMPVQDASFRPCLDFVVQETQFAVVSVIKGDLPGKTLRFRHYDESPQQKGRMYEPQHYHFQTNRTYIVFAKITLDAAIHRQLWDSHTGKNDQGVVLCLDDRPVLAKSVKDALWDELMLMVRSTDVTNVTYANRPKH